MIFYKAVNESNLSDNYIPGTVTTNFKEAYKWFERYNSNKKNGKTKHIEKLSNITIIQIEFNVNNLLPSKNFQIKGVCEHQKPNCWTSSGKTKAQINIPVAYRIIKREKFASLLMKI